MKKASSPDSGEDPEKEVNRSVERLRKATSIGDLKREKPDHIVRKFCGD